MNDNIDKSKFNNTIDQMITPEQMIQTANIISSSLLYSLSRKYLDFSIDQKKHFQASPLDKKLDDVDLEDFYFVRLDQVGSSLLQQDILHQPFTALQTAIASCHHPDRYSLVFIISSDGKRNNVYLGVRSHDCTKFSPKDFVENLGNFLKGNCKGIKLSSCYPDTDQKFKEDVIIPLEKKFSHGTALTGVPSVKSASEQAYPQSLDRLISGLSGSPFMYVVMAEPIDTKAIDEIIFSLRELMGQVHTLGKFSFNETLSRSVAKAFSIAKSETTQISEGNSTSVSHDSNWGWKVATTGIGAAVTLFGVCTLNPLALQLGLSALLFGEVVGEVVPPKQKTEGENTGTATGKSTSNTVTDTTSDSTSFAYGREYLSSHAQASEELIKRYLERFEQARATGCWNVGAYLLSESRNVCEQGGMQLSALLSGEKSFFEPLRVHDLRPLWTGKNGVRKSLQRLLQPNISLSIPNISGETLSTENFELASQLVHPLGKVFNSLMTPLNTEELSLLVNLPQREVPGIRASFTADFSLNPPQNEGNEIIEIGNVLRDGEALSFGYSLPLDALTKHGLVTGITGSGKTTTCKKILQELQKHNIPFLIVEPAKEEYAKWAEELNETLPPEKQITVYMPGSSKSQKHPLSINPLDFISLEKVLSHIDRIKSILNATFPMQEVLPLIMESLLFEAYKATSCIDSDITEPKHRPHFSYLLKLIEKNPKFMDQGYEEKIRGNIAAAMKTRINSLCIGWKKRLFDNEHSTPWAEIFDRPVIINLSHLGDDNDKALTMAVLLLFLYEYRQDQHDNPENYEHKKPNNTTLSHLTVIEEAHRILLKSAPTNFEQASPQGKVAEMFSNILSEIRAYGEGILIVDQVPARLIPDAIKNTNLKIVHRLVATDDRDAMSSTMSLTHEQSLIINRLREGQAIVYGELDDSASWVKITKAKN
jgi:hypothetical protein